MKSYHILTLNDNKMKKTKLYLPPKCEVVKVRTEQQFLASTEKQYQAGLGIYDMDFDGSELDW